MSWRDTVHPDLRPLAWQLPNLTFLPGRLWWMQALFDRAVLPQRLPSGMVRRERTVEGKPLWVFEPRERRGRAMILWVHGGGRIVGHPLQIAPAAIRSAHQLGILTATATYRKAPQHPFPAAHDDLLAVWQHLQTHADELGIDPHRIVLAGESAGGGLVAELTHRLHDLGGPQPAGQVLVYPMLDDRTAADRSLDGQHAIWSNTSNHTAWKAWLGQEPGGDQVPPYAVAARREDLSGLPPAWLMVGDQDLFEAEGLRYVSRLRDAGIDAELFMIEGGFHGFFAVAGHQPVVNTMWDSLLDFVRRVAVTR